MQETSNKYLAKVVAVVHELPINHVSAAQKKEKSWELQFQRYEPFGSVVTLL